MGSSRIGKCRLNRHIPQIMKSLIICRTLNFCLDKELLYGRDKATLVEITCIYGLSSCDTAVLSTY